MPPDWSLGSTAGIVLLLALGGCSSIRDTVPQRSASEQLLIAAAAERSSALLDLALPLGTRAFVDAQYFEGYDAKYAIGVIRDHFLRQGLRLVGDRASADAVIELRAGALSVDDKTDFFGIPSFEFPVPLSGQVRSPEIPLYKKVSKVAVAKFAASSLDAKSGAWISSAGPHFGTAQKSVYTVLVLISWTEDDTKIGELDR